MDVPTKAAVRATYQRIARPFAATRRRPWPAVVRFLDRLPRGSRVVDVGCGNGRHMRAIVAAGHAAIGVDFSRELLRIGGSTTSMRSTLPYAWLEADATQLPLRSGFAHAALLVAVLHHLPRREDRVAALREVRRVLRPAGQVLVSVWAADQPRFRDAVASRQFDVEVPWTLPDGTPVPRFYHLFRPGELESLIIESGLHGETFFTESGNIFGQASKDG